MSGDLTKLCRRYVRAVGAERYDDARELASEISSLIINTLAAGGEYADPLADDVAEAEAIADGVSLGDIAVDGKEAQVMLATAVVYERPLAEAAAASILNVKPPDLSDVKEKLQNIATNILDGTVNMFVELAAPVARSKLGLYVGGAVVGGFVLWLLIRSAK